MTLKELNKITVIVMLYASCIELLVNPLSIALYNIVQGIVILIGGITAIVFFKFGNYVRRMPPQIWQRNQEISKLIRKNRKGIITTEEIQYFRQAEKEGLIDIVPIVKKHAWKLHIRLRSETFDY